MLSACILPKMLKIKLYTTTILPVVCMELSLTLKKEHKLLVLQKAMLRKICRTKKNTEQLRILHDKEFCL